MEPPAAPPPAKRARHTGPQRRPLVKWTPDQWKLWSLCPRRSPKAVPGTLFFAAKVPVATLYEDAYGGDVATFTPSLLIEAYQRKRIELGMVVDCTFDAGETHYHNKQDWEDWDIEYKDLTVLGSVPLGPTERAAGGAFARRRQPVSKDAIGAFVRTCKTFWGRPENKQRAILVFSQDGFTVPGMLICAYQCAIGRVPLQLALARFAEARDPGLYDVAARAKLVRWYNGGVSLPASMPLPTAPAWEVATAGVHDHDLVEIKTSSAALPNTNGAPAPAPAPAPVPPKTATYVYPPPQELGFGTKVTRDSALHRELDALLAELAHSRSGGAASSRSCLYPGTRAATLKKEHLPGLNVTKKGQGQQQQQQQGKGFWVSWDPQGIPCLLLLCKQQAFAVQRRTDGGCVYTALAMRWPRRRGADAAAAAAAATSYLERTLLDGVVVLDVPPASSKGKGKAGVPAPAGVRRLLVSDCLSYEGAPTHKEPLARRLKIIQQSIIKPKKQAEAEAQGAGKKPWPREPLRVRQKDCFPVGKTEYLLRRLVPALTHGVHGLVFVSERRPYGDALLSWRLPKRSSGGVANGNGAGSSVGEKALLDAVR